jgi:glycosyltransferase involved in cell wall biosynthesis
MKKIVFVSWKDILNPTAGGAEVVEHFLAKKLVEDGYEVINLVPGFERSDSEDLVDGVKIKRVGNSILYFPFLWVYFILKLKKDTDFLIDIFNCFSSFSFLFFDQKRTLLFFHHIQGRVWFYQTHFQGVPNFLIRIFNFVGYFLEKIELVILSLIFKNKVIAVSESTKKELVSYSFEKQKISTIIFNSDVVPLENLEGSLPKQKEFTILSLGFRKMKRPMHVLKAFEIFLEKGGKGELWFAGWGSEEEVLKKYVRNKNISGVKFWGRVSDEEKVFLMQKCHTLCIASVKEGWGLVVTEANSNGTPVVGYDVEGLRDSLAFGNGFLCLEKPNDMANKLLILYEMVRYDTQSYTKLRQKCLVEAKKIYSKDFYEEFKGVLFDIRF